jgi:hypothetical protein
VKTAGLDNGLLHIDLQRPVPESKVTEIKISSVRSGKPKPQMIDMEHKAVE